MAAQCFLGALAAMSLTSDALSQRPVSRDSAGIRIVENGSRLNAPVAFTLGAKPSFDVGGLDAEPDKELSTRNGYPLAIRLVDGHVAVTDRTRVQFFDKSGKRLRITGREGGGPGEFASANSICRTRGDTVFASDGVNRRVTVLSELGEYHSSTTLPVGNSAERNFCLNDGTFIATQTLPAERGAARTLRINHIDRAGSVINVIADVNLGVFDMAVRRESQYITWGQNVVFGNAIDYEIRVFSAAGQLTRIIRTADQPESISQSDLEKLAPTAVRANATAAQLRDDARRIAAESHTKTWPAYDRFLTDMSGRLWVQDWKQNPTALEPIGWTAFDANGKMIGRLVIPAPASKELRQTIVHFGKDEVFVRRLDDDGAMHYTAYPLVPRK